MKFSILTAALLCSVSATALADGMPFKDIKPKPVLKPIEKIDVTPSKEMPIEFKPEPQPAAPAPAPAPAVPQQTLAPPQPLPPVPEARTVNVQPNSSFLGISVGMYDAFTHGQKSTAFNLEWQPGVKIAGVLQPLFGGMMTTGGTMLGYGGVGVPVHLTDHVFAMPSVALGAYHKGAGYDLDRVLVYRGGLELAYQFDDKSRLGLNLSVISNGKSEHRDDRTEVAMVTYTIPFGSGSGGEPSVLRQQAPLPLATLPESTPADASH